MDYCDTNTYLNGAIVRRVAVENVRPCTQICAIFGRFHERFKYLQEQAGEIRQLDERAEPDERSRERTSPASCATRDAHEAGDHMRGGWWRMTSAEVKMFRFAK